VCTVHGTMCVSISPGLPYHVQYTPASEAAHDSHRFMQKFRARSMHKAAQHKPSEQCYRVNGCRGTRAAEVGSGEESERRWRSRPCNVPRAVHLCQSCHWPPRCRGGWCPRATQRIRCEHTRYARLHRGCCNAHLPDEALCVDDVLRAAGEENLYQESEDSAKMTGSRMAFASRG
jgi:hypothetical protein